jgi:hypothetical protein
MEDWLRRVLVVVLLGLVAGCDDAGTDDPCAFIACSSRGYCVVVAGAPTCRCLEGYHAVDLECIADVSTDADADDADDADEADVAADDVAVDVVEDVVPADAEDDGQAEVRPDDAAEDDLATDDAAEDVPEDGGTDACAGCLIDEICYDDGELHPLNLCLACDPDRAPSGWSENDSAPCDDGLFCNGADSCLDSACAVHAGAACPDDGVYCNGVESCDELADACRSSGDPCPGSDGDGDCSESCNEGTESCTANDPDLSTCSDGTYCNGADACSSGMCSTHTGNPCPGLDGDGDCSESCNEGSDSCTANDPAASPCNDGLFCTAADTCNASGTCVGSGNPCPGSDGDMDCSESCNETSDSCSANDPNGSGCNDGTYCNGADTCSSGACSAHAGNPCPGSDGDGDCSETCNEGSDSCTANDPTGTTCNDGVFCTDTDACSAGTCLGTGDPCPASDGDDDCSESCNEGSDSCTANDPNGSPCGPGRYCWSGSCS